MPLLKHLLHPWIPAFAGMTCVVSTSKFFLTSPTQINKVPKKFKLSNTKFVKLKPHFHLCRHPPVAVAIDAIRPAADEINVVTGGLRVFEM